MFDRLTAWVEENNLTLERGSYHTCAAGRLYQMETGKTTADYGDYDRITIFNELVDLGYDEDDLYGLDSGFEGNQVFSYEDSPGYEGYLVGMRLFEWQEARLNEESEVEQDEAPVSPVQQAVSEFVPTQQVINTLREIEDQANQVQIVVLLYRTVHNTFPLETLHGVFSTNQAAVTAISDYHQNNDVSSVTWRFEFQQVDQPAAA